MTIKVVVVGISGASGAIYGVRLIEALSAMPDLEVHVVISKSAEATIRYEMQRDPREVSELAHTSYDERDLAAPIASGTFLTHSMVIAPCSIRTLSAVANSANDTLMVRAADVHLKERRPLVLVVRETPLHEGHLRLMTLATRSGAVILPPVPGFYVRPTSIEQLVDHTVGKVLDSMGLPNDVSPRWSGIPKSTDDGDL